MNIRNKWLARAGLLVALLAGAFLVVVSGIVPVKASSGHFAITNWFLHFAMQRSVSTHSLSVEKKKLDEPWLVLKGAGHYETGCRPCHGAPDLEPPVIPQAMTPHPPKLLSLTAEWDPEELFYIVKHGVKFTAMPAWPAQERDDEVWAVVAFLLKMSELDADAYRQLVHGKTREPSAAAPVAELVANEVTPSAAVQSCARCHGQRGEGRQSAAFPKLAGQKRAYQVAALEAYARGERRSGIMQPIAAGLTPEVMAELSQYYATQPSGRSDNPDENDSGLAAQIARGRVIATQGVPGRGVPSCMDCHGASPFGRNPMYPNLTGQHADYLVLQLELFKARKRGGSPYAHLMNHVAARLTSEQMNDVALYYAAQSP
jgi:cytochrome c553